mmetsp:Transcript_45962/g.71738  ORF Transcript_45962/g.71738 Transcript_45962/m.71738 type:complete len:497 (+) Transcript_45962:44-1534(+)
MATVSWATFISLLAALGAFLFGLDIGYIALIIESPSFKRDVGHMGNWADANASINSVELGLIVGLFSLGAVISAFPTCSAFFLDSWGRKESIKFGTMLFLMGCILQACAFSVVQICMGRFVAGLSIGLLSTIIPVYQSELAPASMRGSLTSLYQLMITFGILVAVLMNVGILGLDSGWRLAILFQAVPALALLCGTYFMPRSPRWLVQKGFTTEALRVLQALRSDDAEARREYEDIVESYHASKALGEPCWNDLRKGRLGKLLLVGIAIQLLQQLVGMNAFMYFGPQIFQQCGFDPLEFQLLSAAVNFFTTFPAIALADRAGRRFLMALSALGMTVSCLIMGFAGRFVAVSGEGQMASSSPVVSKVIMTMVFAFIANFAYGWGPIAWVYCAEIFPLKYRSVCLGLTTTANWVGNYLIAQFTPVMLQRYGFSTFFCFAVFSFSAFLLALWLPETKGLVLERVGELFDRKFGVDHADTCDSEPHNKVPVVNSYGTWTR